MQDWEQISDGERRLVRIEFAVLLGLHIVLLVAAAFAFVSPANAHPGRTAADGCHNDRKNGGRHCHGSRQAAQPSRQLRSTSVYYRNCDAARAAGAAPIRRGEPGYASHLDRDGDGIACE